MIKDRDQLEYAISQYLDGTLNEFDRRVLEERLATDAEARLLASEYAQVDSVLKNTPVTPEVDFDALASRISASIADEDSHVAQPIRMPGVWVRYASIAAGIVLAVGVGLHMIPSGDPGTPDGVASNNGTIEVTVEFAQKPSSPPVINVAVGPTDQLKQAGYASGLVDDAIITRVPRLVISAADQPSPVDERLY
jgi:negative regulator of sigma E activity